MGIRARENVIGAWAFLLGLIIALLVGILAGLFDSVQITPIVLGVLAVLGIVVGFCVSEKDVQTFLLASVSLVLVSYTGISGIVLGAAVKGINIGGIVSSILQTLLALFVPA